MTNLKLLCLENPLLDIQAVGDESMLQKYGLEANGAILAEEKHMGIYDDLLSRNAHLIAGGAAQNTARGAQYILPADSVLYIGCVGNDEDAKTLQKANEKVGLRVEYRIDEKQPTGRCGVVITGHNRSMCTHLAAANEYKLEHLQSEKVWPLVKEAQMYYVGGYHMTVCPPAIMALAKEAAENNKTFVLGAGAPFVMQFFKDPLMEAFPYVDYFLANETEARTFAETQGFEEKHDVSKIARKLAALPKQNSKRKRVVVITQGTDETVVATEGEEGVQTFPVHAVSKDKIVDTNGAGDAFAGGFLAGLVEGKSTAMCVDMGQWLAALGIQELGPQYPFPAQKFTPTRTEAA